MGRVSPPSTTTSPSATMSTSTTSRVKNFSQPIHWWENHGSRVLSEFYALIEGQDPPDLTHLIPAKYPNHALLTDLHEEIKALFYCVQESIKCLGSTEEDNKQGRSGHGETFWKDRLEESVVDFRGLWVEFRRELGKCGLSSKQEGKRGVHKENREAEMAVVRWDEFFGVEVTGEGEDANAEASAPRTGAGDLKYWRRELNEQWDMELSE